VNGLALKRGEGNLQNFFLFITLKPKLRIGNPFWAPDKQKSALYQQTAFQTRQVGLKGKFKSLKKQANKCLPPETTRQGWEGPGAGQHSGKAQH
jgi:hypothetical protein